MGSLWSFLAQPKNQRIVSWLGGGLLILVTGVWTVVTYVWPPHGASPNGSKFVCAEQGGIAAGRDASSNIINYNGSGSLGPGGRPAPCADAPKAQ